MLNTDVVDLLVAVAYAVVVLNVLVVDLLVDVPYAVTVLNTEEVSLLVRVANVVSVLNTVVVETPVPYVVVFEVSVANLVSMVVEVYRAVSVR